MPRARILGNGLNMGGLSPAGGGETWASYVQSLAPLAWWRMRQTSGTNEPNAGSLGSAVDLTITSTTLAQTGKLGANEAYLLDGASSRLQTPNNATLAGLTAFEYVFLVNPSSAGESNTGALVQWGDANDFTVRYATSASIICNVFNTVPTVFNTTTTTVIANNTWSLLFVAYDDSGDRKPHLRQGVNAAVTEFAYSANNAMTGTYKANAGALNLFNRTTTDRTFAGLADEVMIFNGNLTPAQRTRLAQLAGV